MGLYIIDIPSKNATLNAMKIYTIIQEVLQEKGLNNIQAVRNYYGIVDKGEK